MLASSIASTICRTVSGGNMAIYLVGATNQRIAVAEAVSKAVGWPVVKATSTAALLSSPSIPAIVDVDDSTIADAKGAEFLEAQPLVIQLVEMEDFADNDEKHKSRQAVSRFDVAVGSEPDVPLAQIVQSIRHITRLSDGLGDGTIDANLNLDLGANTFFLSLTFPDMRECLPLLPGLERGVDALELRVDLLQDRTPWSILRQVAILKSATQLPIIYTVRSKDQCGAFPNDAEAIFKLLGLGLRAGVEVLDVEACWDRKIRSHLLDAAWRSYRGTTRLLGSYHVVGRSTTDQEALRIFQECFHDGRVDAVKVVLTANSMRDAYHVHELAAAAGLPASVPVVALCLGEVGKLSRVLNSRYTPVTNKLLPYVAAPGQLTAGEIMNFRRDLGMVPSASFCLLGHPISKSPSPAMHNAAFQHCLLPHTYSLFETEDVLDLKAKYSDQNAQSFGGCSVTIPHKQAVIPLLHRVSPSVDAIGAVNTVVVEREAGTGQLRWVGHNTDWKGIVKPIVQRLRETGRGVTDAEGRPRVALVVGGGGTALAAAYGMTSLGLRLLVFNRTPSKAQDVAARFGGTVVHALTPESILEATGGQQGGIDVVVSTIPSTAGFLLPPSLLRAQPVVMDVAYRPAETALLAQAREAGCPFVQGAEMLIAQGVEQFQLWTKRRAPEAVMRAAVYATVEELK
ncbi:3-phosphoshikimate 1-carboxyvinyltransferase [Nannochloropsis oceanica]